MQSGERTIGFLYKHTPRAGIDVQQTLARARHLHNSKQSSLERAHAIHAEITPGAHSTRQWTAAPLLSLFTSADTVNKSGRKPEAGNRALRLRAEHKWMEDSPKLEINQRPFKWK